MPNKLTQKEMDLSRSIQEVIEEIVMKIAKHVKKKTRMKYLCLAGGVALNCVANGKILKQNLKRQKTRKFIILLKILLVEAFGFY